jgi:FdhD protein
MGRVTSRRKVVRLNGAAATVRPDTLAGEEPLEIRVNGERLTVTMRTPGHDFDLVAGFLATEGVVGSPDELIALRYCADGENTYNLVDASLAPGVRLPASLNRNLFTTSACGICGRDSIDAVRTRSRWPVAGDAVRVSAATLYELPRTLRAAQRTFATTGGLHAAGLFTSSGELLCAREDVGRHNAVDKVVGWALREGRLPLRACILMVSGRASFELTQKAAMAGIPILAAVSAPSNLAADLADNVGLTLIAFLRNETCNVYTATDRITTTP